MAAAAHTSQIYVEEEKKPQEIPMQLVIKNEEPQQQEPVVKIGDRVLGSADELDEKRRFEEQRKRSA